MKQNALISDILLISYAYLMHLFVIINYVFAYRVCRLTRNHSTNGINYVSK